MPKKTKQHSGLVGGSTAERLLNCPGSRAATLALPPSADIPSVYAEAGTFAHEIMTYLMRSRMESGCDNAALRIQAYNMIGDEVYDRAVTKEHVDTLIWPALDALDELEGQYGDGFDVIGVELHVTFPNIIGAFGTMDLVLGSDNYVLHVDWKFGQGIPVKASYTDELGEKLNAQLMFYLVGSMHSHRRFYRNKQQLVIAIIQPLTDTPLTSAVVTRKDVKWFREDLAEAVMTALDRDPPLRKGEHCRFCPAKVSCPQWTGPLLDLTVLGAVPQQRTDTVSKLPTAYGEYLAKAKALVDILAMFKGEIDAQLHAYLSDGGQVPGWRLKQKVKQRKWIEDILEIEQQLAELGFAENEIFQFVPQTFKSVDATAKKLGVKVPEHLRVAPETDETTVARVDDPAPVVERQLVIEQFKDSLKALQGTKH